MGMEFQRKKLTCTYLRVAVGLRYLYALLGHAYCLNAWSTPIYELKHNVSLTMKSMSDLNRRSKQPS